MGKTDVLKVFFPQSLVNERSGICLGTADPITKSLCILAIAHPSKEYPASLKDPTMSGTCIIGTFKNQSDSSRERVELNVFSQEFFIKMEQRHYNEIPACEVVKLPWKSALGVSNTTLLIIFDELQILSIQYVFVNSDNETEQKQSSDTCTPFLSKLEKHQRQNQCESVDFLFSSVHQFSNGSHIFIPSQSVPISCIRTDTASKVSYARRMCGFIVILPIIILRCLFHCLTAAGKIRLFQSDWLYRVFTFPATGAQLANKTQKFCRFMGRTDQEEAVERELGSNQFIRMGNSLSTQIVDLLLGLMVLSWMYTGNIPELLADIVKAWADQTGIGLQHLLHWLMGAPAGLKLNTFLAHFLGNFFLYHVYLWIGYLGVLLPIMSTLLWCIAGAGFMGLSVQLALASDLMSLLTFHIYCFYVYAARIYSLQVSGLLSLARLFQGKKWNVLRQRVDSCSYDVDQLFMGTLLFTMLFFMLPTTALFYVVFTVLRLVILIIQSLLTVTRELLHSFPWFSILLWLTRSDMLNHGVQFQVLPVLPWQPASLSLQMQLMTLQEALQVGRSSTHPLKPEKLSPLLICSKLVRGHLIYPWGGEHR